MSLPGAAAESNRASRRGGARAGAPLVRFREARAADAPILYRLIAVNREAGHLLPRALEELKVHAPRFFVAAHRRAIVGCAELAPLSRAVAEVRSLVVDERYRGHGIATELVDAIRRRARLDGYATLCAFTHDPVPFVRLGFSIVPHVWIPEKIALDCQGCPLFRRCGQYAMVVPLGKTHGADTGDRPDGAAASNPA